MLTKEQLKDIERELNVKLPKFYKDFHFHKQDIIVEAYLADELWFSTDKMWIVNHNKEFLKLPRPYGVIKNKI